MKIENRAFSLKDQRMTVQLLAELFELVQACIGGFGAIGKAIEARDIAKALEYAKGGEEMVSSEMNELVFKFTMPISEEQVAAMKDMEIFPEKRKGAGTVH